MLKFKSFYASFFLIILFLIFNTKSKSQDIRIAADRFELYAPYLKGKNVALLVNQTSVTASKIHLVDFLLEKNIKIKKVFAPEHGFRGKADAGEMVKNGIDQKTKLPIISLYGKNKKPSKEALEDIDVIIFDIQDVGVRFYTYISSLHYLMEAAAENDKTVIILDRPNPNGKYIDGPVLDLKYQSFVGMHPIPILHGLTVGELANMIQGEKWLKGGLNCKLKIIGMQNYTHSIAYELNIKPSPNLPNTNSIRLYASLALFEGTNISVGRGTHFPFETYGYPQESFGGFEFTPKSIIGMSKYPKHENKTCHGFDLRKQEIKNSKQGFNLHYLMNAYKNINDKELFFIKNNFFEKLAGNGELRNQIKNGLTESEIRESWKVDLENYLEIRKKYTLYPN